MHTKITQIQLILWLASLAGQSLVCLWAWRRRYSALALFLGIEAVASAALLPVAYLASWQTYYVAWYVGKMVDYAAQAGLAAAIYVTIRKTGIPSKNHPTLLQIFAGGLFAVAILTLRFPLVNITHPQWRTFLSIDHTVCYWLCLILSAAPFYSWLVDSARDTRLILTYLGLAVYVAVHAASVDATIATHLFHRFAYLPDAAYLVSLVLWFRSCLYSPASHQIDPAQMESLKAALLTRSHIHELPSYERLHRP